MQPFRLLIRSHFARFVSRFVFMSTSYGRFLRRFVVGFVCVNYGFCFVARARSRDRCVYHFVHSLLVSFCVAFHWQHPMTASCTVALFVSFLLITVFVSFHMHRHGIVALTVLSACCSFRFALRCIGTVTRPFRFRHGAPSHFVDSFRCSFCFNVRRFVFNSFLRCCKNS